MENIKAIKTITPDYRLSMFFMLYTAIRTAIRLHHDSQIVRFRHVTRFLPPLHLYTSKLSVAKEVLASGGERGRTAIIHGYSALQTRLANLNPEQSRHSCTK